MQTKSSLIIVDGQGSNRRFPLDGIVIIGRADECDVVLDDPKVSRRHAKIWVEAEDVFLEDMGSTCGTFLNTNRIRAACNIQDGDVIGIGAHKIRFDQQALPVIQRPFIGNEDEDANLPLAGDVETRVAAGDGLRAQSVDDPDRDARDPVSSDETRFAQWEDLPCNEEESLTRAIVPDGTRLLDPNEIPKPRGFRQPIKDRVALSGSLRSRRLIFGGILAGLAVVMVYTYLNREGADDRNAGMVTHHDPAPRSAFTISYPETWQLGSEGIFSAEHRQNRSLRAKISAEIERDDSFRYEGFSKVMVGEREHLQERFPECEVETEKVIVLADGTKTQFFKLKSGQYYVKALLIPDDNSRLRIICATSAKRESEYDQLFSQILASFKYNPSQFIIDYPLPSAEQKVSALRDPDNVRERMMNRIALAEALYRLRETDSSNLSQAICHLQETLTLAEALVEPPPDAEHAARLLHIYQGILNERVHFLRGQMQAALQLREWMNARNLASSLMRVIGDQTHDVYQEAYRIEDEITRTGRSYIR